MGVACAALLNEPELPGGEGLQCGSSPDREKCCGVAKAARPGIFFSAPGGERAPPQSRPTLHPPPQTRAFALSHQGQPRTRTDLLPCWNSHDLPRGHGEGRSCEAGGPGSCRERASQPAPLRSSGSLPPASPPNPAAPQRACMCAAPLQRPSAKPSTMRAELLLTWIVSLSYFAETGRRCGCFGNFEGGGTGGGGWRGTSPFQGALAAPLQPNSPTKGVVWGGDYYGA